MFIDEASLLAAAGKGGDGCVSFHREKYRPRGGPDGGSGGRGGSVFLVADSNVASLAEIRDHPHRRGGAGKPGSSSHKQGATGIDVVVPVPVGTLAYDEDGVLLADVTVDGERFCAAEGARGGRGNAAFVSPSRRIPSFGEKGEPGRERRLRLELRLIADVGVIGLPNAGKSSFVAAVSKAHPKIAPYPFTTLEPLLGVVERANSRFTVCDIPGLVQGAHEGKGLGTKFLRHASRVKVLLHLIDLSSTDRDCLDAYRMVRSELQAYSDQLATCPEVVALNKVDLDQASQQLPVVLKQFESASIDVSVISVQENEGIDDVIGRIEHVLATHPGEENRKSYRLYRSQMAKPLVQREGRAWRVQDAQAERAVAMSDLSHPEALARLQGLLEHYGVEVALRDGGVQPGDEVRVGSVVFEWWPPDAAPAGHL